MEQLKVGDMKITWLDGGVTHLDGGAMFGVVPKPLWSRFYEVNEKNQIELRTDPMLIQVEGKNILIESGIGNEKLSEKQLKNFGVTSQSNIDYSLKELGLTTDDINIILMTHMHFDHACGLTKWDNGELVSTFKNAVIYTSAREWDEMRQPNIRSINTYWEENWKPIEQQVKTFEKELEVIQGLKMVHTGGHSDGHSIIMIDRNGEKLIHMADLMPTHAHQNPLWVLAYDDYPMDSIMQKDHLLKHAKENETWFLFYHDAIYRALKWDAKGNISESLKRK